MVLLLLLITGLHLKGVKVRRAELALINDLQNRLCRGKGLNVTTKCRQHANVIKEVGSEDTCWNTGALGVGVMNSMVM